MDTSIQDNNLINIYNQLKNKYILNNDKTFFDYQIVENTIFSLPNIDIENNKIEVSQVELIEDILKEYLTAMQTKTFNWQNQFRKYIFEQSGFIDFCLFNQGKIQKELFNQRGASLFKYKEEIFNCIQEYFVFLFYLKIEQKKK